MLALFVICIVLFTGFACYEFSQDGHMYFQKYWDMWTERNQYFDEALKWKTKYHQLKQRQAKDKPW